MRVARSIRGNQRGALSHLVSGSPPGEYLMQLVRDDACKCRHAVLRQHDADPRRRSDAGCFQLIPDLPDRAIELAECQGREVCADDRGPSRIKRRMHTNRIADRRRRGRNATQR
jgi:hypothetical protein